MVREDASVRRDSPREQDDDALRRVSSASRKRQRSVRSAKAATTKRIHLEILALHLAPKASRRRHRCPLRIDFIAGRLLSPRVHGEEEVEPASTPL
jgi:hypothetical protein